MAVKIEKATGSGLCFGLRRAITALEKVARERGGIETLGPVAHNPEVVERMTEMGVKVVRSVDDISGKAIAIASHGATPQVQEEIQARNIDIVDLTCPFVHRAQLAARKLAGAGFFVVVFGDAEHTEVKGILGWAKNKGLATTDEKVLLTLPELPRRIGVLSQTTQIPSSFVEFTKRLIDVAFGQNSELRVVDTICHDIRKRQAGALELAKQVDVMIVVGDRSSANTNRLVELCSAVVSTHFVQSAQEIDQAWLKGKQHIGIASGASTPEQTVDEVLARLETLA